MFIVLKLAKIWKGRFNDVTPYNQSIVAMKLRKADEYMR